MRARSLIVAAVVLAAAVLGAKPAAASVARNVGAALAARGSFAESAVWLERARSIDPSPRASVLVAKSVVLGGGAWGAPSATDADAIWLDGSALFSRGDRDAAIDVWARDPAVAFRLMREGDAAPPAQGRRLYDAAVGVAPGSAYVARLRALFLSAQGDDGPAALAAFAQAERMGAGEADAYFYVEHAHALQRYGSLAEAVAYLALHPVDAPLANAIRGEAARVRGDYPAAAQYLERARDQAPQDPWTLHQLAALYVELGRPGDAAALWRSALRASPGFAPALGGLASIGAAP